MITTILTPKVYIHSPRLQGLTSVTSVPGQAYSSVGSTKNRVLTDSPSSHEAEHSLQSDQSVVSQPIKILVFFILITPSIHYVMEAECIACNIKTWFYPSFSSKIHVLK